MKECKKCLITKPLSQFYVNNKNRDGLEGSCKPCRDKQSNARPNRKTMDAWRQRNDYARIFRIRYSGMKSRTKGMKTRKYSVIGKELPTIEQFLEWCTDVSNMVVFTDLHSIWRDHGFQEKYTPTIDRIDNDKGYSIDNIQWMSKSDNSRKKVVEWMLKKSSTQLRNR